MDWDEEQINTYNPLEVVELIAIQLRQKSNRFTAYGRVAFRAYKNATHQEKKDLIRLVTGDVDAYPGDYVTRDLVSQAWREMTESKKKAWHRRAFFLNLRPVVGEFRELPRCLIGQLDIITRNCIKEECDLFMAKIRACFLQKYRPNTEKKQVFLFPQKVEVGNKLSKLILLSPVLHYLLFRNGMSRVLPWENFSINTKYQPGYAHLASPESVRRLMTVEDVSLMTHHSYDLNCDFALTSVASLVSVSDNQGRGIKCYGWCETRQEVTFIYNPGNEGDLSLKITFPRPFMQTQEVVNPVTGRARKVREYVCDTVVNGYVLKGYIPVCIRIHYRSLNSFRFVGARLAYRTSLNNDSEVSIISSYTS